MTTTQDLETAQPEETSVATQFDALAREQEESDGSSTVGTGPSSEGMHGIRRVVTRNAWHLLEASGSRLGNGHGGVRQEHMPSWSFTGRLSVPYGNKRGPADPATCADWR